MELRRTREVNGAPGRAAVGIIGLGRIGGGVAGALLRGGFTEIAAFDVRAGTAASLQPRVRRLGTPALVADATDIVLIAVMDDDQLREVLDGEDGVLLAESPAAIVVILSTVTLDTVRWAAGVCAPHGVEVLDCGVSGGPQALEHSEITAMVGGARSVFATAVPVLEAFARPVIHVGELGSGMRAKLARNLIIYTDWYVAWEAARLASAAGIDVKTFVKVVEASERWSRSHLHLLEQGIGFAAATDEEPPATAPAIAAYAEKDLRAAVELGAELGLALPAATLARAGFPAAAGLIPDDV